MLTCLAIIKTLVSKLNLLPVSLNRFRPLISPLLDEDLGLTGHIHFGLLRGQDRQPDISRR